MTRNSLPLQRLDGTVIVRPLTPTPAGLAPGDLQRQTRRGPGGQDDTRVERAKIVRDLAIIALLALTIVAGAAVMIGALWRDAAVAESQARIIEAEQAARVKVAEAEILAAEESADRDMLLLVLVGIGTAIIALVALRPSIIIGR
jgi:hypothetical protein